jgi:hypothetical protein
MPSGKLWMHMPIAAARPAFVGCSTSRHQHNNNNNNNNINTHTHKHKPRHDIDRHPSATGATRGCRGVTYAVARLGVFLSGPMAVAVAEALIVVAVKVRFGYVVHYQRESHHAQHKLCLATRQH